MPIEGNEMRYVNCNSKINYNTQKKKTAFKVSSVFYFMKIYFSVRDVSKEDMKNLKLSQNDAWIRDKWKKKTNITHCM